MPKSKWIWSNEKSWETCEDLPWYLREIIENVKRNDGEKIYFTVTDVVKIIEYIYVSEELKK